VSFTDHFKEARLAAALAALQEEVRANAANASLRITICELLCLMGQWDRARKQLEALTSLGEENHLWVNVMGQALLGEAFRREVFAGRSTPLLLGEPAAWMAQMIYSLGEADISKQKALRREAFDAAPTIPAKINGVDVPWLADADSRLGPVLEAIMEAKYYWVPLERIRKIIIQPPTGMQHLVWVPAQVTWVTGGQSMLLIPCRYPGTEDSSDDHLRLARLTTWEEMGDGEYRGIGQRMFAAGDQDFPLLDLRTVEMAEVAPSSVLSPTASTQTPCG